jgi:hypothetical protein
MHPYLRQALAQSHIDELTRRAAQRRIVGRLDAPAGRLEHARQHRVTARRAHTAGIFGLGGAHR